MRVWGTTDSDIPTPRNPAIHFLTNPTRMRLANPIPGGPHTVNGIKTEEEGSDVNLASYLLLDAFRKDCEIAVVISNDSDLRTPIIIAEQESGITVGVINPQSAKHRNRALTATFFKQLRPNVVARCQLPEVMNDADGRFHKPSTW